MFDLFTEPFWILDVDPRATKRRIEEAFATSSHRKSFSDASNIARTALLDPDQRLLHEVRYPLDYPASEIETFYAAVSSNAGTDELLRFADQLWPLARANFAAHIASHRPASRKLFYVLLESHASIDGAAIYLMLKEARAVAEIPAPSLVSVNLALAELLQTHASAAFVGYSSIHEAAEPLLNCTQQVLEQDHHHFHDALRVLLGRYRQAIYPMQRDAAKQIENLCVAIGDEPEAAGLLENLSGSLSNWTSLSAPLFAWDARFGPSELTGEPPIDQLRLLIGRLTENGHYEVALKLAVVSRDLFRMVPTTLDQLAEDAHLARNLSHYAGITRLQKMIGQLEIDIAPLIAVLEKDAFGPNSGEPAKSLWRAFVAACTTSSSELPWQLMRDFAVRCSNSPEAAAGVASLMMGLLDYGEQTSAPRQILKALRDNLSFMRSFIGTEPAANDVKALPISKRLSPASRLFRLGSSAYPAASKRTHRALATALALTVVAGLGAASYARLDRLRLIWPKAFPVSGLDLTLGSEAMPPIGTGQHLALDGVRYCHFQQERLNFLKPKIQSAEDARAYNLMIVDYNSRCSDIFYQDSDLKLVLAEVSAKKPLLEADALRIMSTWPGHARESTKK
jgi:hypothetical protein